MLKSAFTHSIILICLIFLSSCATGNKIDYAALVNQERVQISKWRLSDNGQQVLILGDLIESKELESFVDKALKANPGLQQTLLTLCVRQAQYRQASGEQWPTLTAKFAASREENSNEDNFTGSATVSWELDLWRKLADDSLAALKDANEQEVLYQSAKDTLAAEVMTNWLGLTAAFKNIEIEQQRLETLEKTEAFIIERYRNGLGTLESLDSARSSTASSKASLESFREILAQQQRLLRTLIGEPGIQISVPQNYTIVLVPLSDLPNQTLQRRPDLKAAFLAIEAAGLRSDVAYKDLLPSISLQAALEDVAASPASALLTSPVWSLLGQLTAPLFQGGKLRAKAKIADLETAVSFQNYRETLYRSVQEIEDAIGLERSLIKQQGYIETALKNSQNSFQQYAESYRQGLVSILDLLTVQRQTFDLKIKLNNLIYDRLANRVNLGLALGLGVKQ
ncbi:TolC family protein [Desulfocicer niacini]